MHPKVYQTRSSTGNERVKYIVWTSEMDDCLTEVLAEQVKKGNKLDNMLKPAALEAAVEALNENFGMYLSKGHIKNRLKTWRKQFAVLKELLAHRGFAWNKTQKMVVADDSVWNDYIKVILLPVTVKLFAPHQFAVLCWLSDILLLPAGAPGCQGFPSKIH